MVGTDANATQIVVVVVGFLSLLVTQAVQLLTYQRGREAAKAAHEALAQAIVNGYNATAQVAQVVGAPVPHLPVDGEPEPSTSEVPQP